MQRRAGRKLTAPTRSRGCAREDRTDPFLPLATGTAALAVPVAVSGYLVTIARRCRWRSTPVEHLEASYDMRAMRSDGEREWAMDQAEQYDYIIAGAGSSGAV